MKKKYYICHMEKKGKKSVLTKVSEERYRELVELQKKLGYKSVYELLGGLIHLELRCMRDYPDFHDGKEPTSFSDLEDMLEMYQAHRIGDWG